MVGRQAERSWPARFTRRPGSRRSGWVRSMGRLIPDRRPILDRYGELTRRAAQVTNASPPPMNSGRSYRLPCWTRQQRPGDGSGPDGHVPL